MYRALTWLALRRGIALDDVTSLEELARENPIEFDDGEGVSIAGHDVTTKIREPVIDSSVPIVARHPEVREVMRERQRALGEQGDSVIEGRDIGVVVAPHAELKIWLVADPRVRAERRHAERDGITVDMTEDDMRRRDERDAGNTHRADGRDRSRHDVPQPRAGHRPDRRATAGARRMSTTTDKVWAVGRPDDRDGGDACRAPQGLRQGASPADRWPRDRMQPLPLGRPTGTRCSVPTDDLLHGKGGGASCSRTREP